MRTAVARMPLVRYAIMRPCTMISKIDRRWSAEEKQGNEYFLS